MILTCPRCATRYLVDPASLGAIRREVRCAKCGEQWYQDAPPPELVARSADVISPPAMEARGPRPAPAKNLPAIRRPPPRRFVGLGWAALGALVIAILAGGYFARQTIMAAVPQTQRVYTALGLAAPPTAPLAALEIRNLRTSRKVEEGKSLLVITGEIANPANQAQILPAIRVALRDGDRKELAAWTVAPQMPRIGAGAVLEFATQQAAPTDARDLEVKFASE